METGAIESGRGVQAIVKIKRDPAAKDVNFIRSSHLNFSKNIRDQMRKTTTGVKTKVL
jgi:hypothetical protein